MDPSPRGVKRHHGIVRLAHWLNAVVLAGMIASGLQIYLAFPHIGQKNGVYAVPNPFDSATFPEWAGSAAGSPAGSTGTSPSPGRS